MTPNPGPKEEGGSQLGEAGLAGENCANIQEEYADSDEQDNFFMEGQTGTTSSSQKGTSLAMALLNRFPNMDGEDLGFEFCSQSGQHRDGSEDMGEAFCPVASSPSDQAGVAPARQGHEKFITEGSGENESWVRVGISEEDGADLLVGEKVASSSLETEEGEGGLEMSEKEDFTTAGAEQGLVTKEKQEKNLGKGLMVEPLPSKSKGEVVSIDGESGLEKSDGLGRVLRGSVGSGGKGAANKALRKQAAVEERFPLKKRRLASQGKLEEGDILKVACLCLY